MGIELKGVVKKVDADTHIYTTDLKLSKGGFNVLLGTTLSGKTTLMRLMAGLEKPTSGEVWFNDENVTGVPVQKRSVAMVYQAFVNYPSYTVYENIASPLKVAKVPKNEIKQRVESIAELLKLTPMLNRMPSEISGGQQQRTALARALVKNAELVLLDEPLANLDYKLREELRDELPKLFEGSGATVVYATSEPMEALLLGGHTATLHEGRVIQFGETAEIYHSPNNLTSATVFSHPPINTARIIKKGSELSLQDITCCEAGERFKNLADGEYILGVRPYHLTPYRTEENSIAVEGTVKVTEISGSDSVIHIHFGDNSWVSESHGVHPHKVGETINLYLNMDQCLLFDAQGELIPS
jgi:glycerol transport system ATP-binding protein